VQAAGVGVSVSSAQDEIAVIRCLLQHHADLFDTQQQQQSLVAADDDDGGREPSVAETDADIVASRAAEPRIIEHVRPLTLSHFILH